MSITIILACLHSRSSHAIGACGFGGVPVRVRPGNLTCFCGFIASHFTLGFLLADRQVLWSALPVWQTHRSDRGEQQRGKYTFKKIVEYLPPFCPP